MRLQNDLDAVVLLFPKHGEPFRCIFKSHVVRDDEAGIDIAVLDSLEQRAHVALDMTLPGPDGQGAVHERTHWKLVYEASVDSDDGYDAAIPARHNGLA
jgi:hypothetical protein